jgi:hypothetical protein
LIPTTFTASNEFTGTALLASATLPFGDRIHKIEERRNRRRDRE